MFKTLQLKKHHVSLHVAVKMVLKNRPDSSLLQ